MDGVLAVFHGTRKCADDAAQGKPEESKKGRVASPLVTSSGKLLQAAIPVSFRSSTSQTILSVETVAENYFLTKDVVCDTRSVV
jgi:hypothetical protein